MFRNNNWTAGKNSFEVVCNISIEQKNIGGYNQ